MGGSSASWFLHQPSPCPWFCSGFLLQPRSFIVIIPCRIFSRSTHNSGFKPSQRPSISLQDTLTEPLVTHVKSWQHPSIRLVFFSVRADVQKSHLIKMWKWRKRDGLSHHRSNLHQNHHFDLHAKVRYQGQSSFQVLWNIWLQLMDHLLELERRLPLRVTEGIVI